MQSKTLLKTCILIRELFEMARRILWSQEDLNAVDLQESILEEHNTRAEGVRGEVFSSKVCNLAYF